MARQRQGVLSLVATLQQLVRTWWRQDRIRIGRSCGQLLSLNEGDRLLIDDVIYVVVSRIPAVPSHDPRSETQHAWDRPWHELIHLDQIHDRNHHAQRNHHHSPLVRNVDIPVLDESYESLEQSGLAQVEYLLRAIEDAPAIPPLAAEQQDSPQPVEHVRSEQPEDAIWLSVSIRIKQGIRLVRRDKQVELFPEDIMVLRPDTRSTRRQRWLSCG